MAAPRTRRDRRASPGALTRAGGPMLTAKLLKLCMEKKDVRGSTGTIHYDAGQIRFEAGER